MVTRGRSCHTFWPLPSRCQLLRYFPCALELQNVLCPSPKGHKCWTALWKPLHLVALSVRKFGPGWPAPSCMSVASLEPGPHFLLPALFHEIQMLGTVSGCGSLFKTLPWGTFRLLLLTCLLDSMVLPVYSEFQNDKQLPSFCFSSFF